MGQYSLPGDRNLTDYLLLVLTAAYLISLLTFLHPCDALEDGSRMYCYVAWFSLIITGVLDLVIALIHFLVRDTGKKRILDLGIFVMSAMIFLIPGTLIPLCADPAMHCRAVMRPGCIVAAVVLLLCANADLNANRS